MRAAYAALPTPVSPCLLSQCDAHHCRAQANGLKVREFLANEEVAAFLTSGSVASLTFKAKRNGPNISKEQAELNSDEWHEIEFVPNVNLTAIPSSDAFDTESVVESTPSEAGSSASHAATPPGRGRGRGRGRGGRH